MGTEASVPFLNYKEWGTDASVPSFQSSILVRGLLTRPTRRSFIPEIVVLPEDVVKDTGRLKASEDQTPVDLTSPPNGVDAGSRRGTIRLVQSFTGSATLSATAITLPKLMEMWRPVLDRPVVYTTDIKNLYDIPTFQFDVEIPPGTPGTIPYNSQIDQILNQLGLKLEPAKAPAEVLVIDRVEKPSENWYGLVPLSAKAKRRSRWSVARMPAFVTWSRLSALRRRRFASRRKRFRWSRRSTATLKTRSQPW
jgi:hypothetical protein